MRTNEERTELILTKTKALKARRKKRRTALLHSALSVISLAVITAAAVHLPQVDVILSPNAPESGVATILGQNNSVGYILMGIFSFLLGVCLTLLLSRFKHRTNDGDGSEDKNEL